MAQPNKRSRPPTGAPSLTRPSSATRTPTNSSLASRPLSSSTMPPPNKRSRPSTDAPSLTSPSSPTPLPITSPPTLKQPRPPPISPYFDYCFGRPSTSAASSLPSELAPPPRPTTLQEAFPGLAARPQIEMVLRKPHPVTKMPENYKDLIEQNRQLKAEKGLLQT
jgi:hypothetical protein